MTLSNDHTRIKIRHLMIPSNSFNLQPSACLSAPWWFLSFAVKKIKQVNLSCFFLGEEIRRCSNYVKENVINLRHFVSNLVDAHSPATLHIHTVWHENFAGVYFCGLASFCVLWELIFAVRTDWFFLLGINFCDFQKVPSSQH